MSNISFLGIIRKNYHNWLSLFSRSNSDQDEQLSFQCRKNAFKITTNRRPKLYSLLAQKDTVIKLIELYRQNECLWNPKCPDYKSDEHQEIVWKTIARCIGRNIPVILVKRKVLALRKKWEQETLRIQEFIANGGNKSCLPKLFYYSNFKFLEVLCEDSGFDQTLERIDSGSEQIKGTKELKENVESKYYKKIQDDHGEVDVPSESMMMNRDLHIDNLCDAIRIDLQHVSTELFFEAKWKILDVLRDVQLKEIHEKATNTDCMNHITVGKTSAPTMKLEHGNELEADSTTL